MLKRSFVIFMSLISWACAKPIVPIQQLQTGNGIPILFVPAQEIPMVDIYIAFDAGSARDTKEGLAALTNDLLDQGVKGLTADQIAEQMADTGVQFGTDINRDMATLSLRSLADKRYLTPAVKLFNRILTQPSFPKSAFMREKQTQLRAIALGTQQPSRVANKAIYEVLYKDHPYAHDELGTQEDVSKITLKDIQQFYKNYYVANNAVIAIVGAIDKQQAKGLADQLVKNLRTGKKAAALPQPNPRANSCSVNINFAASQTNIRLARLGITRQDPDYFPLIVGNYSLGGGSFTSRLTGELREKRGLTYAAYSYFQPLAVTGPFMVSLATRTNKAEEALSLTKSIMSNFIKNGPSEKELVAAKANITGGFALNLDSNASIGSLLLRMAFYGLPLDYLDTYQANVLGVTIPQIKQAYRKRIKPGRLCVVQVGQALPAS